jgi:hypothetical protein
MRHERERTSSRFAVTPTLRLVLAYATALLGLAVGIWSDIRGRHAPDTADGTVFVAMIIALLLLTPRNH